MNKTTNYGFSKPSLTDNALITVISDNFESIDTTIKSVENKNLVQTAGGTATSITLTLPSSMDNGYQLTFIATANNGASSTTINGTYKLYKPGGSNPTLIKDKAYNIYYNSSSNSFFVVANASGNTVSAHVLAGDTYSNDIDTDLVGTMPNNGVLSGALNCGASYTIPLGYTSGGTITANSLASQTVASATADKILYGITAWVKGVKVTGSISSKGATTYTPSTTNQTIVSGQYLSGSQTILGDADLIASNIISGKSIFGVAGSATIESLGGRKVVMGSYVATTTEYFTSLSSNDTVKRAVFDVSGFDFTPYMVLIFGYRGADVSIINPYYASSYVYVNVGDSQAIYQISANSNIIVTYGRVRIPYIDSNGSEYYVIIG